MKWMFPAAIAWLAIAAGTLAARDEVAPACDAAAPGWAQSGASRLYEGENLFEYMDGNSEGYLIYGFVRMRGVTCTHGDEKVLIDVSELRDAESAYGLFSSNRDVQSRCEKLGTEGQVLPRKVIFTKGKYYVEIAAEADGDHSAQLREMAKRIEPGVPGMTSVPEAISWFPVDGLTGGPPRLVPESVLGIRALKRGYVAQYGPAKAFVVTEATADAARAVMEALRARFGSTQPAAIGDESFQVEDKYLGRICVVRRGVRLMGYAGVARGADAVGVVGTLMQRVPK